MRSIDSRMEQFSRQGLVLTVALALLALLSTAYARSGIAQAAGPEHFSSAEQASQALFMAIQKHDEPALMHILGAGKELIHSDDEAQDKVDRERFVQKYEQMHRLVRQPDGAMLLYIGAENWPFPIPLVFSDGTWSFDAQAGMEEVVLRHIGENELAAIQVCHALVMGESADRHESPDQHGPIGALLANVGDSGSAVAFHGYYFRRLERAKNDVSPAGASTSPSRKQTARFEFLAYPAEYGVTGVMTFVVDRDGVVYEKDLGPNSVPIAKAITASTPDATWHWVDDVEPDS